MLRLNGSKIHNRIAVVSMLSRVHTYLCRITMSGKVSDLPIRYKRAVFTQKKLDRINFRSGNCGRVLRNPPGVTRCWSRVCSHEKWQMLFNFGKCKCLHTGLGNTGMNYEMGVTILSKTVKEKDLGVKMNASMKVSEQCRIAASKGYQILGMIRRNITYKEKSLIVPLYKAIVRPHLEYCIQAWNPHIRKDIDMLEKNTEEGTKLIPGLRDLVYEERLKECGLTTLETRRLRGDQI